MLALPKFYTLSRSPSVIFLFIATLIASLKPTLALALGRLVRLPSSNLPLNACSLITLYLAIIAADCLSWLESTSYVCQRSLDPLRLMTSA